MDAKSSYNFFSKLQNDNSCFIYQASFNDEITDKILRLTEYTINNVNCLNVKDINSKNELSKLKNKLAFLMAECFQNIIRHSEKPEIVHRTNNLPQMLLTRNIGNTYYIASSNLVDNEKVDAIKHRLKNLNNLDEEELKALHLDMLVNDKFYEKGGNGIGMIEMAKKSGQKLEYDFEFVNFYLSLFYLQLKLKNNQQPTEGNAGSLPLSATKELHELMFLENVLLIFKGDFSQESILPILGMIENNLKKSVSTGKKKKILYLLIELLQNISKHAKKHNESKEGIFIISKKGSEHIVNTGNFVDNDNVEDLKNHLNHIIELDENGLTELYKKNLAREKLFKGGAGIGLIDIAKYSNGRLSYEIKPINEYSSFFSLNILI